nr:hypothetical protein [Paraburkholderia sp. BL18I3N2]
MIALDAVLGTPLIVRDGITPTQAGCTLLQYIQPLHARYLSACQGRRMCDIFSGSLHHGEGIKDFIGEDAGGSRLPQTSLLFDVASPRWSGLLIDFEERTSNG